MPQVETTVWINAPLDRVYAIAKDNRSFPDFMKDVESVTILEQEGNRVLADWVGLIPQFMLKVRWQQEEVWDDATTSSKFHQIKGDYDKLEGTWKFETKDGGTQFSQALDYEYEVPTLGPLVRKVILSIVKKNLENINQAIKQRAETSS